MTSQGGTVGTFPGEWWAGHWSFYYYFSYFLEYYYETLWTIGLEQANDYPTLDTLGWTSIVKIENIYHQLLPSVFKQL